MSEFMVQIVQTKSEPRVQTKSEPRVNPLNLEAAVPVCARCAAAGWCWVVGSRCSVF